MPVTNDDGGAPVRAATPRATRPIPIRAIPLPLVRDLVAVALRTEPRPTARSRLDAVLGARLAHRLLDELVWPTRRVA